MFITVVVIATISHHIIFLTWAQCGVNVYAILLYLKPFVSITMQKVN